MTSAFYGFDPPEPDDAAILPDYFRDITVAIDKAHGIRAELDAEVPGFLKAYIEYARGQAIEAMAALVAGGANDADEIHHHQKIVAAYASVMLWVQGHLEAGRTADQEWSMHREAVNRRAAGEE